MFTTAAHLFLKPITSSRQWVMVVLVAFAFVFAPQYDYNDWERNTEGLQRGLHIYDNPDAVYPPWSIVLLWPYYLLTSPGSRVASVLVVGWLSGRCRWPLTRFFAIVLSPFFIWTMLLSNIDLLVFLLPIVLWEASRHRRWHTLGQVASLALLLIKPQGSFLLIGYWLWTSRARWREMILPFGLVALLVVVTSAIGQPTLLQQWIENLQHPSADNLKFWASNNVSMTDSLGLLPAAVMVGAALAGGAMLLRRQGRMWTTNHTYAILLLAAMLLSPYTSNQSLIAAFAFIPSLPGVLLQYAIVFAGSALGIYLQYDAWWALFLGLSMLWLYRLPNEVSNDATTAVLIHTDE